MSEELRPTRPSKGGLALKLISISKSVRQLSALSLARIDILPGQDQLLLVLRDTDRLTVGEMADRLNVRASTVSKMADILADRNWVQRIRPYDDQRRSGLVLTDAGRAKAYEVRVIQSQFSADLTAAMDDPAEAFDVLAKLDSVLMRRLRRLR